MFLFVLAEFTIMTALKHVSIILFIHWERRRYTVC